MTVMSRSRDPIIRLVLAVAVVVSVLAVVGLAATLALAGATDAAAAQQQSSDEQHVQGSPDIDAVVSEPTLQRGTDSTVTLQLLNTGSVDAGSGDPARVTTARGVSVSAEADDDAPIEVQTDTVAVGTLTRDAPASVPIEVSVPANAEAGEYDLEVKIDYEYTNAYAPRSNVVSETSTTETTEVTVVIDDDARFSVVDAETDAPIGGTGDLTLTLKNVGEAAASDARIDVGSETIQTGSGGQVVGEWAPGETKNVSYEASVVADAEPAPQELTATVDYTDEDGTQAASRMLVTGVTPAGEQSFAVEGVDSTLAVGDDGVVTVTLANDGPVDAEALVVRTTNGEELGLADEEYAVGNLEAGERATIEFETTVGASVDPGPRLLTLDVEYRDGDERRSSTHDVTAPVTPQSDEFEIEVRNGTVTAGDSAVLKLAVTNDRDEPVSEVSAKLFANSPLSVSDDEAFVDELEPGETAVLQFEYRASGSALAKEYPVALDFQYEDHRGETRMSETYRVPVSVEESEGGGFPTSVLLVGGLLIIGTTGFAYRRRSN